MNHYDINHRHPAEIEAEATLTRLEPYPDGFTLADRTIDRMARIRAGLNHVMIELLTQLDDDELAVAAQHWLMKVWSIVEITRIDAEGKV